MIISEFSNITGISCSTLRYYEEIELLKVDRDQGNRRIYSQGDIEWVKFLQRLKNTGMSLKDMKVYSKLRYLGDDTLQERMELLSEHKKMVTLQKKQWEEYEYNLEMKIKWYQDKLNKK